MINLHWQKYDNFLLLYSQLRDQPRLIYVIGETHHCYIGSVGGRGGEGGLSVRYQKQYVDRSVAIFGSNPPINQPAFAAIISDQIISIDDIEPIERKIQDKFILAHGKDNSLFKPRGKVATCELVHTGDVPSFLLQT